MREEKTIVDTRFNIQCLKCKAERKNDNGTWVCDTCLETYSRRNRENKKAAHVLTGTKRGRREGVGLTAKNGYLTTA